MIVSARGAAPELLIPLQGDCCQVSALTDGAAPCSGASLPIKRNFLVDVGNAIVVHTEATKDEAPDLNWVSMPLVAPQDLNFAWATWIAHGSPPFACSEMAKLEFTALSVRHDLFRQKKIYCGFNAG